jgi:hypothetical protein
MLATMEHSVPIAIGGGILVLSVAMVISRVAGLLATLARALFASFVAWRISGPPWEQKLPSGRSQEHSTLTDTVAGPVWLRDGLGAAS